MANPTPPRKKNRRRKEKIRNKIKLELPELRKREKRWVKKYNLRCLSDVDTWQSTSLLNRQRSIKAFRTNIARFYKAGGPNL